MKWKTLTFNSLYEVSEDGQVRNKNTGKILTPYNDGRYLRISLLIGKKPKTFFVHKLVAQHYLDSQFDKLVVDHIDNNKLNNHYSNLQLITQRLNVSKDLKKSSMSSSYVGVTWKKSHKKWQASIKINGKKKHLGLFDNEDQAHEAYQSALLRLE